MFVAIDEDVGRTAHTTHEIGLVLLIKSQPVIVVVHHGDNQIGVLGGLCHTVQRHENGALLVLDATHPGGIVEVEAKLEVVYLVIDGGEQRRLVSVIPVNLFDKLHIIGLCGNDVGENAVGEFRVVVRDVLKQNLSHIVFFLKPYIVVARHTEDAVLHGNLTIVVIGKARLQAGEEG